MATQGGTANIEAMKETAAEVQTIHLEANDLSVKKMMQCVRALTPVTGSLKLPGSYCQSEIVVPTA